MVIKFRAWNKEEHKMYYDVQDAYDSYVNDIPAFNFGEILDDTDEWIVMQYAGLEDKYKKELYDGDIFMIGSREDNCIYQVVYDEENLCYTAYRCLYGRKLAINLGDIHRSCEFEIIGNIYENPELLNKSKGEQ